MASNYLFRFINQNQARVESQLRNAIHLDRDVNGVAYYRYELAQGDGRDYVFYQSTETRTLRLVEEHISVYEHQYGAGDADQYHYTASFVDEAGIRYRLHVYFNELDELISHRSPYLSVQTTSGEWVRTDWEVSVYWQMRAIQLASPVLHSLRTLYHKAIQDTEKAYSLADANAQQLSADTPLTSEVYVQQLDRMVHFANELYCLTGRTDYQSVVRFLTPVIGNLRENQFERGIHSHDSAHAVAVESDVVSGVTLSASEADTVSASADAVDAQTTTVTLTSVESSQQALLDMIEDASQGYHAFLDATPDTKCHRFLEFDEKMRSVIGASIDARGSLSQSSTLTLTRLDHHRYQHGASLLRDCIFGTVSGDIQTLSSYAHLLDANLFDYSLLRDNATLLAYLMRHANQAINTRLIGKSGLCPVQYCFQHKKWDCLALLLQKGASAMVEVDGYPVAHALLTAKEDAVYRISHVLTRDAASGMGISQALAAYFRDRAQVEAQGSSRQKDYLHLSTVYRHAREDRDLVRNMGSTGAEIVSALSSANVAMVQRSPVVARLLREDLEIGSLIATIRAHSSELFGKLSDQEMRHLRRFFNKVNFAENVRSVCESIPTDIDGDVMRQEMLRLLRAQNSLIEKLLEHHELKLRAKNAVGVSKRRANQINTALMAVQNECIALAKPFAQFYSLEFDNHSTPGTSGSEFLIIAQKAQVAIRSIVEGAKAAAERGEFAAYKKSLREAALSLNLGYTSSDHKGRAAAGASAAGGVDPELGIDVSATPDFLVTAELTEANPAPQSAAEAVAAASLDPDAESDVASIGPR